VIELDGEAGALWQQTKRFVEGTKEFFEDFGYWKMSFMPYL
jgi:hypothetical protein